MPFDNSKYDIDEETRNLPSTVSYFPRIGDLEDQVTEESGEDYRDSALKKISSLQIKLEQLQYSRDSKNIGGLNWNFNNFADHTLYALANEVFGFNGWSTLIEECAILEMNVAKHQGTGDSKNGGTVGNTSNTSVSTSETSRVESDASSEDNGTRYTAKCICVIRLTLQDGTWTRGIGEGTATNVPHKYVCYSKCKKEAITDGMKNAIISLRDLYFRYELKKISEEFGIN